MFQGLLTNLSIYPLITYPAQYVEPPQQAPPVQHYQQPQQPLYEQPQQPLYEQPQQPIYEQPAPQDPYRPQHHEYKEPEQPVDIPVVVGTVVHQGVSSIYEIFISIF